MPKRSTMPIGGFLFAFVLNCACFVPGASYYAPVLIGVGWFFGAVWSLLNIARFLRIRDFWGVAFGAMGLVLCFTPSLWLTGRLQR